MTPRMSLESGAHVALGWSVLSIIANKMKRRFLNALKHAASQDGSTVPPVPATTTTSIVLPTHIHTILRQAALVRAAQTKGRLSVSAVIADLVEEHRDELLSIGANPGRK